MPHDAAQYVCHIGARLLGVVMGLQVNPALRIGAEVRTQAQGSIHSDAAQTFNNFMDAPGWHDAGFGKRVLADCQGF